MVIGELTVDSNRGCTRNSRDVTCLLTSLLEAPNCTTQINEVHDIGGIAVAITINPPGVALLFELLNQILIERHLKFGGQVYFVGLNHFYLDRGCLYL